MVKNMFFVYIFHIMIDIWVSAFNCVYAVGSVTGRQPTHIRRTNNKMSRDMGSVPDPPVDVVCR